MRVIREHNDEQTAWQKNCRCGGCGSVLKVEEDDLTRNLYLLPSLSKGGAMVAHDDKATFVCPVCDALNYVPPVHLRAMVMGRLTVREVDAPTAAVQCVVIEGVLPQPPLPEDPRKGWSSAFSYWTLDEVLVKLDISVDGCNRCLEEPWAKGDDVNAALAAASTLKPGETCGYCERKEPCR
jgi:hypothetical protein